MKPSGPLRQRKIEINKPTTTGGRPMPVLIKATVAPRPGNLASARAIPRGIPIKSEMKVAEPEIWSERQVMDHTSPSSPKTNSAALRTPCQISSMSCSQLFFPFVGDGHKQRLAEFFNAKAFD